MDKSKFGEGIWMTEPDELDWITSSGFPAYIRRNSMGFLCGYVGVSKDHCLYGKDYENFYYFDVHGGITFSGTIEKYGVELFWIGFDVGHAGDLIPAFKEMNYSNFGATYKDIGYVKNE